MCVCVCVCVCACNLFFKFILQMIEALSGRAVGKASTGKPPNLDCLLKLSKTQQGVRATQVCSNTNVVNQG